MTFIYSTVKPFSHFDDNNSSFEIIEPTPDNEFPEEEKEQNDDEIQSTQLSFESPQVKGKSETNLPDSLNYKKPYLNVKGKSENIFPDSKLLNSIEKGKKILDDVSPEIQVPPRITFNIPRADPNALSYAKAILNTSCYFNVDTKRANRAEIINFERFQNAQENNLMFLYAEYQKTYDINTVLIEETDQLKTILRELIVEAEKNEKKVNKLRCVLFDEEDDLSLNEIQDQFTQVKLEQKL